MRVTQGSTRGVWYKMNYRCYSTKYRYYHRYGGRGIAVCQRWRESFEAFVEDMGRQPLGLVLDRIDNDGNYSCGHCLECLGNNWPLNVRWATTGVQARNKTGTNVLTALGQTLCMTEWERLTGLSRNTIKHRIMAGMSPDEAVSRPSRDGTRGKHRTGRKRTLSDAQDAEVVQRRKLGETWPQIASSMGVSAYVARESYFRSTGGAP